MTVMDKNSGLARSPKPRLAKVGMGGLAEALGGAGTKVERHAVRAGDVEACARVLYPEAHSGPIDLALVPERIPWLNAFAMGMASRGWGGYVALAGPMQGKGLEAAKNTVLEKSKLLATAAPGARQRKASPKAVSLLERWKDLPSVDPRRLRADNERLLDSTTP
jgi:hypothetical protein